MLPIRRIRHLYRAAFKKLTDDGVCIRKDCISNKGRTLWVNISEQMVFRGEANVKLTANHAFRVGRYLGWYYGRDHKANRDRQGYKKRQEMTMVQQNTGYKSLVSRQCMWGLTPEFMEI